MRSNGVAIGEKPGREGHRKAARSLAGMRWLGSLARVLSLALLEGGHRALLIAVESHSALPEYTGPDFCRVPVQKTASGGEDG